MKKSIKMIIAAVVGVIIIAIVCLAIMQSGKKAITMEQFEEKAKENGYKIADIQNDITKKEEIINAKLAISEDYSYFISFYILKDNDSASNFYKEQKEEFAKTKQEENEPIEKKSKSYEEYSLKSNGKYMYISRIENTIVQFNVNESEEQKVKEFLEKCF